MRAESNDLITSVIKASSWHMKTLELVRTLQLPDWAIGAGFVRNAIWDHQHGYTNTTPLSDIDVLYFDPKNTEKNHDKIQEEALFTLSPKRPWSVRNQARMHLRNSDAAYTSTENAMNFWLETPTCVAVRLEKNNTLRLLAPFGVEDLIMMRGKPTLVGRKKIDQYSKRMREKDWLTVWPKVVVEDVE